MFKFPLATSSFSISSNYSLSSLHALKSRPSAVFLPTKSPATKDIRNVSPNSPEQSSQCVHTCILMAQLTVLSSMLCPFLALVKASICILFKLLLLIISVLCSLINSYTYFCPLLTYFKRSSRSFDVNI